jgi:pimeloyl-ACP methyl ester carboxylesterase
MRVRAVYDAVAVPGARPPYESAQVVVHYPAVADPGDPTLGIVAPAADQLPVLLLAPNFNCPPELYAWLAKRVAGRGWAVVTWSWVAPLFGGRAGLGTGVDLSAVTPEEFGSRIPSRLLPALLDARPSVPDVGDALDLSRVVLGGHSAGGTLALLCSSWLKAPAFSYGGHTRTQVPQGFGEDHYLDLGDGPPLLLMGGAEDGIGDAIARAQGQPLGSHPMAETARRAVPQGRSCELVLVDGANHYSFCDGYDGTSGRGYLEAPASGEPGAVREQIAQHVERFLEEVVE